MKNLNDMSIEEKREFVSQFNLIDDTLCTAVLEDKEASEYLLSILLGRQIEVVENKTQYSLKSITEHSVILDVLVKDNTGRLFNIEINSYDDKDTARRLRYYAAMIDTASLGKKQKYEKLRGLYMIYISKEDPIIGDDENIPHRMHYEVEQRIKGINKVYDNGLHIHYFVTSANDESNSRLAALMKYFEHSDPNDNSFGALSRRVNYFKSEVRGVDSMCKIVRDYVIEDKIKAVKNMLADGIPLEKALKYEGLDRETYEKYCQSNDISGG